MEKEIENIINTFFSKLDFNINSIELVKEKDNIFLIVVKTDDTKESSLIIGPHGKNLESIKNLLKLIIIRKIEKNIILHLEVNDYLKSKDEKLIKLVIRKIQLAKRNQKDISMPFLSSYERKKVHSYVAEKESASIYTESRGKGKERKLFICCREDFKTPTETKLSIDINGNDI